MKANLKKILTFSSIGLGVIGTGAGIGLGVGLTQNKTSNQLNSNQNNVFTTVSQSSSQKGDLSIQPIYNELSRSAESEIVAYTITINNAEQEFGTLKFYINGVASEETTITANVGDSVQIIAIAKDPSMTVRDLIIYGDNANVSLGSTAQELEDGSVVFTFQIPDPSEFQGENPFASGQLTVTATYIKKTIGNDINWTYNAVMDDINSYTVAKLDKDTNWSVLSAEKGWDKLFNEDSRDYNDPVSITIYLNGHNLILDKDLKVPAGYNLIFIGDEHNNNPGKVVAENQSTHLILNAWYENGQEVKGGNITFYSSAYDRDSLKTVFGGWGLVGEGRTVEDLYDYANVVNR